MSKETLTAYKNAGAELVALANGLTAEQINKVPADGDWPISYIVHHIFDAETYFATRYMNILIYDNPAIVPFDEELLPAALNYENRTFSSSVKGVAGMHAVVEEMLESISDDKWSRTGNHPELGAVTLTQVLAKQAGHITEHVEQIKKLLA